MRSPAQALAEWVVSRITRPRQEYRRYVFNDPEKLKSRIRPGDVVLVDGDQRVSQVVKYLTMSPWSHSAIFVGSRFLRDPAQRAETRRQFGPESRYLIVEALVDRGVVVSPLVKYIDFNIRVCRPTGLTTEQIQTVLDEAAARLGFHYDRRNILDLFRYLLPMRLVPMRLREDALHFGSGKDTETICSSFLAQAFEEGRTHDPAAPHPTPRGETEPPARTDLRPPDAHRVQRVSEGPTPEPLRAQGFDLSPNFDLRQVQQPGAGPVPLRPRGLSLATNSRNPKVFVRNTAICPGRDGVVRAVVRAAAAAGDVARREHLDPRRERADTGTSAKTPVAGGRRVDTDRTVLRRKTAIWARVTGVRAVVAAAAAARDGLDRELLDPGGGEGAGGHVGKAVPVAGGGA